MCFELLGAGVAGIALLLFVARLIKGAAWRLPGSPGEMAGHSYFPRGSSCLAHASRALRRFSWSADFLRDQHSSSCEQQSMWTNGYTMSTVDWTQIM
mmetsp:Transcript_41960/g.115756  ORF Transcript_41960/g.115756 Transcript_41960/m.115756 type:complete len:97 (-) Transcript_41960:18-308(-)